MASEEPFTGVDAPLREHIPLSTFPTTRKYVDVVDEVEPPTSQLKMGWPNACEARALGRFA
jgi:hypothetical protein